MHNHNTQKVLHFVYVQICLVRPMCVVVAGHPTKAKTPSNCHEPAMRSQVAISLELLLICKIKELK